MSDVLSPFVLIDHLHKHARRIGSVPSVTCPLSSLVVSALHISLVCRTGVGSEVNMGCCGVIWTAAYGLSSKSLSGHCCFFSPSVLHCLGFCPVAVCAMADVHDVYEIMRR
jgi:hypothetical protein